jgi:phosphonate transport system permease protein
MPLYKKQQAIYWRRFTPLQEWLYAVVVLLALSGIVWAWQWLNRDTLWIFLLDAPKQLIDLGARLWPPNSAFLPTLWQPLLDTIHMATLGTLLGVIIATPLAFFAARNTTPSPLLRPIALLLIVVSRSVNSLIWALMLVILLGPGLIAGILAIALRSVGFIGKLLYEAIEEIDQKPVEALLSTGASAAQRFVYAIWPQVAPAFVAISVFRWDINIRESTVMGLVGAGGIGLYLKAALDNVQWANVSVILILIALTVLASELISSLIRRRLI